MKNPVSDYFFPPALWSATSDLQWTSLTHRGVVVATLIKLLTGSHRPAGGARLRWFLEKLWFHLGACILPLADQNRILNPGCGASPVSLNPKCPFQIPGCATPYMKWKPTMQQFASQPRSKADMSRQGSHRIYFQEVNCAPIRCLPSIEELPWMGH